MKKHKIDHENYYNTVCLSVNFGHHTCDEDIAVHALRCAFPCNQRTN